MCLIYTMLTSMASVAIVSVLRVVLKLVEEVTICLIYFFSTEPQSL